MLIPCAIDVPISDAVVVGSEVYLVSEARVLLRLSEDCTMDRVDAPAIASVHRQLADATYVVSVDGDVLEVNGLSVTRVSSPLPPKGEPRAVWEGELVTPRSRGGLAEHQSVGTTYVEADTIAVCSRRGEFAGGLQVVSGTGEFVVERSCRELVRLGDRVVAIMGSTSRMFGFVGARLYYVDIKTAEEVELGPRRRPLEGQRTWLQHYAPLYVIDSFRGSVRVATGDRLYTVTDWGEHDVRKHSLTLPSTASRIVEVSEGLFLIICSGEPPHWVRWTSEDLRYASPANKQE